MIIIISAQARHIADKGNGNITGGQNGAAGKIEIPADSPVSSCAVSGPRPDDIDFIFGGRNGKGR